MADFTVVGGHFSVRVNDGHSAETYEIDAESPEAAKLVAAERWRHRNDKVDAVARPIKSDTDRNAALVDAAAPAQQQMPAASVEASVG